jgi:hypothetical protein
MYLKVSQKLIYVALGVFILGRVVDVSMKISNNT